MLKTYAYVCVSEECQHLTELHRTYEERNEPGLCEVCGELANYVISSPAVLQHTYIDGQRRKSDPAWQRLKETSKLKLAHASAKTRADKNKIKDAMDQVNGKTPPKKRKRPSEFFDA